MGNKKRPPGGHKARPYNEEVSILQWQAFQPAMKEKFLS